MREGPAESENRAKPTHPASGTTAMPDRRSRAAAAARPATESRRGVDVTRNQTYRLLALTNSLGRSAGRDFSAEVGLTVPEWRVLSVLGSHGVLSLAGLTRILAVDKGWVSRTVAQLERRGLVSRTPDPEDERLFALALTHEGVQMHLRGSRVSIRRQKELEAAFSEEELAALYDALARLQSVAEAMEARAQER